MCVDYKDLNKASPKDNFPLPHTDILVDNTSKQALLSFVDGYAGYNLVKMTKKDMENTILIIPWGDLLIHCYAFWIKKRWGTYQRIATTLIHEMMHKEVEVYVDDMIVNSKDREGHHSALEKMFMRLQKYNMRLTP